MFFRKYYIVVCLSLCISAPIFADEIFMQAFSGCDRDGNQFSAVLRYRKIGCFLMPSIQVDGGYGYFTYATPQNISLHIISYGQMSSGNFSSEMSFYATSTNPKDANAYILRTSGVSGVFRLSGIFEVSGEIRGSVERTIARNRSRTDGGLAQILPQLPDRLQFRSLFDSPGFIPWADMRGAAETAECRDKISRLK